MAVFHIVCKIILIYLFASLVLAVYDVFRTFYGVITKQIQGKDDDMEIFGKLEFIFLPSIFIYDGLFFVIRKIFNLSDEDELDNA